MKLFNAVKNKDDDDHEPRIEIWLRGLSLAGKNKDDDYHEPKLEIWLCGLS